MRKTIIVVGILCLYLGWAGNPHPARADVEWRTLKELELKSEPLDIFQSPDGQQLFILIRGEVLIYSLAQQTYTDRIPVGSEFDRVAYAPQSRTLTLTSSAKKSLLVLSLDFIQKFDISGLPFKGPENARVTLVVFSDYQ